MGLNKFTTTFEKLAIGDQFVEAFTTCDEIAIRIEPTTHKGKPVNARRIGGKLILMVDREPVFVSEEKLFLIEADEKEGPDYKFYWECPECDRVIHISIDECECDAAMKYYFD